MKEQSSNSTPQTNKQEDKKPALLEKYEQDHQNVGDGFERLMNKE